MSVTTTTTAGAQISKFEATFDEFNSTVLASQKKLSKQLLKAAAKNKRLEGQLGQYANSCHKLREERDMYGTIAAVSSLALVGLSLYNLFL